MEKLTFGKLTEAWTGEASDFTPLLAEQLDALGDAIGVDLVSLGEPEVSTAGGRRIDIVAQVTDGAEFVVENQYGRADHDHLTRGLAYAVALGPIASSTARPQVTTRRWRPWTLMEAAALRSLPESRSRRSTARCGHTTGPTCCSAM